MAVDAAARLGAGDQPLHHVADVVDVEPRAVEGAVGGDGAEHLADRLQAALARRLGRFDHEGGGAHAEDHPVAPAVERQGRLGHVVVGGGCAGGEEAGAEPAEERVGRDVVGRDHDDATATAGADPVLGDGDGLGGAGARRVDLRVRAAGADQVGELRVAHRQDAEKEAAVEAVRIVIDQLAEVVKPPVDLVESHRGSIDLDQTDTDGFQLGAFSRRVWSVAKAWASVANSSIPGKAEAKITPVSSRSSSGSPQRSGRWVPRWVVLYRITNGMPASRSASKPAAIASCAVRP